MEIYELKQMKDFNELDMLYKIIELANSIKKDTEKVLKGEKAASIRVRSKLQDIKTICDITRDKIQIRRGKKITKEGASSFEKAILKAEDRELKENIRIKNSRDKRISKLSL